MYKLTLVALTLGVVLSGCNSSSDEEASNMAQFSFGVSDAPVDAANQVMVCFDGVELVGGGQPPQEFGVGEHENAIEPNDACLDETGNVIPNTVGVDLLSLQGANAEELVSNAPVPAGAYGQLRLNFVEQGSYVERTDGSEVPLDVPSSQLRLDGVTLTTDESFHYTLEFDLRRAIVAPPGLDNYLLSPRGLRLVDNAEVGHLEGEVAEALLMAADACAAAPENPDNPVAAVYLFTETDLAPEDMYGNNEDEAPYASVSVFYDGASAYPFNIGYIQEGDYTLGVTCQVGDDPETDNELVFIHAEALAIHAGETHAVVVGEAAETD